MKKRNVAAKTQNNRSKSSSLSLGKKNYGSNTSALER